jgi:hypothetical protein
MYVMCVRALAIRFEALCFTKFLIHIYYFFTLNNAFYKLQSEKNREVKSVKRGARKWVLLYLSKYEETPCPEWHQHDWRSDEVYHVTLKLFPQGHDTKQCSPS